MYIANNYGPVETIHDLFTGQAAATPDAVALRDGGISLTYAELDARSNRLAAHLRALGLGRGGRAGMMLRRSADAIVAMLAILKTGAAFVPFDPGYPRHTLLFMIGDSSPSVMIVQRSILREIGLTPFWEVPTICMEEDAAALADGGDVPVVAESGPDDLAYVMYTSGSTGQPKGVMTPHRGVVRLVKDTDYARFGADEVFLHLAPLTFDASTFEIWGALLNGATLAIEGAIQPTLEQIARAIETNGVTTMWLTAGLFHLMVDHKLEALRGLRQLLAGGDVLSPSHVLKALRGLPDCRLINGYGPTENTTFTCCHTVPKDHPAGRPIPIGRPIRHTDVHVLDNDFRPVAMGEVGQLCTGGRGVALGYLNREGLTREKFIADPFSDAPGAKLYLTGDLVRVGPDGALEFLGRMDRQVKISGNRVELEEIEEALRQCDSVADAVAVVHQSGVTKKQIVAYVTARAGQTPTPDALRAHVRSRLPGFMVPHVFAVLERFPLSPTGKVDRGALPDPGALIAPASARPAMPRGELETALAAIWRDVLGAETIGVNDNFFDLGGSSLQLIEVQEQIRHRLGRALEIVTLFRFPRISLLAAHLAAGAPAGGGSTDVPRRGALREHAMAAMRRAAGARADAAGSARADAAAWRNR